MEAEIRSLSFGEGDSIRMRKSRDNRLKPGDRVEWTFTVETVGGATKSEAALERFAESSMNRRMHRRGGLPRLGGRRALGGVPDRRR